MDHPDLGSAADWLKQHNQSEAPQPIRSTNWIWVVIGIQYEFLQSFLIYHFEWKSVG